LELVKKVQGTGNTMEKVGKDRRRNRLWIEGRKKRKNRHLEKRNGGEKNSSMRALGLEAKATYRD